jgi:hypothetical protein
MKTRTLLILAVVVGLAILVAGGIQLLRVSGQGSSSGDHRIGQQAKAGDLVVTVVSASDANGQEDVVVRMSGVDDPAGLDGFRLVVIGAAIAPAPAGATARAGSAAEQCTALTVAEQTCTLVFDTSRVTGSTRVLLLRRGEDQVRWALA